MNRDKFISKDKIVKPIKPAFIKQEFQKGDKLSNLQIIYTFDGYFEIGCEFLFIGLHGDKLDVYPILDNETTSKHYTVEPCFKVIERGWNGRFQ